MNILSNLLYIFISIYIFILDVNKNTNIHKYIYIILLLLLIINNCIYNNINIYILILYYIFILINVLYFYLSNLDNIFYEITIITLISFLFLTKLYTNKIIIIIIIFLYYFIINISLKFNKIISNNNCIKLLEYKPSNIKVALCVSGKIDHQNMKNIYESWQKNLLNYYNVDIFMNIDEDNDYIKNIIKPKKCILFNKLLKLDNLDINSNIMFYRIYECNKYSVQYELDNNIKYDIIIRIRCDILLFDRLYLENFKPDIVYFPSRIRKAEISNIYNLGITDQLFISDRESMNKTCNIYLDLNNKILKSINCKIPEVTLLYYLLYKKIKYSYFYYSWIINYYKGKYSSLDFKFIKKILFIFNNNCFINLK